MPNEALGDCLVRRMLIPDEQEGSGTALPPMEAPLPLWRVMSAAYASGEPTNAACFAVEIEALRDVMFPAEPAMHIPNPVAAEDLSHWSIQLALHRQRRAFRDYLTEQARVAREASPD